MLVAHVHRNNKHVRFYDAGAGVIEVEGEMQAARTVLNWNIIAMLRYLGISPLSGDNYQEWKNADKGLPKI